MKKVHHSSIKSAIFNRDNSSTSDWDKVTCIYCLKERPEVYV